MTKSRTIAAAVAALTLAITFTTIGGQAQARPRFGAGLGIGLAAGTLIRIATATSGPAKVEPAYTEWRTPWAVTTAGAICAPCRSATSSHTASWRMIFSENRYPLFGIMRSAIIGCGRRQPPSILAPIDKTRPVSPHPSRL